ncbi:MAG TPA: porin [Steroidobacteraceae bacterium]|nr:porin [Steroidobacteraceae bacterium]
MNAAWKTIAAALAAAPLIAVAAETAPAESNASGPAEPTLEQRLEQAEQRIAILERKLELADEAAASTAKAAPVVKAAPTGVSLASSDSSTVIKLRGNLAVDGRFFLDQNTPATADTFLLRRARPYIEGTVGGIYDFRFMPDFGGGRAVVQDAYVNARFKPWFAIQAGKFKGPVGLERLQPDQYNRFMELGFPTGLLPNRDLGVQVAGSVLNGALSYAVGYFDGTTDGGSTDANATADIDNDGRRDWEGRVFALPFANSDSFALRGLGVGLGASYVNSRGVATSSATAVTTTSLLASYKTPGQQSLFSYRNDTASTATINEATVADGVRRRLTPQVYYYVGPLGLLGEYAEVTQQVRRQVNDTTTRRATLQHNAWQVSASWFLTGEEAAYASFTPRSTFQPGKPGAGAWELVARYQSISFDPDSFTGGSASFANPATSVQAARAIGLGVNWYLNQNFKWQLDYELTRYDGGAAVGDRPDERAALTRFSLVF